MIKEIEGHRSGLRMNLQYGIDQYIEEADNIYDLVGNCFGVLCDNITNHQLFISRYIDEGKGEKNNPNLKKLNEFSVYIMKIMEEYKPSRYEDILSAVLKCIDEVYLIDYGDDKENQLTIIYCILAAIDAAAANWENKWMTASPGPLDRQKKTKYRVYINIPGVINLNYKQEIGRGRVCASNFFEQFGSFRFVDSDKWKEGINVPQIKYLPQDCEDYCGKDLKLKIAVIPASCRKNFEFVPAIGSGLKVDYSKNDQDEVINIIRESLNKAIEAESNIIVLPEYVISPKVHEEIEKVLKEHAGKSGSKKLLAVFEGTTWTEDDNNVMRILDSWGEEIGKYYKYTPFTKNKCKIQEQKMTPPLRSHGFEQHEALANPGKCCDMLAIEKIGLFLPAICRDAIDGEYTVEILKMLFPVFVIIAAWSPSVASFEVREEEFANKYFTSSVLANACSSVDINSAKIGNGCIVSQENTIAGAAISDICRDHCTSSCGNGDCVYIIEYNFKYQADNNTKKAAVNTEIDVRKL